MTNSKERANIAQQTLQILEQGRYQNRLGEDVPVDVADAKANTIHYTAQQLDALRQSVVLNRRFATRFEVNNESTLAAARRLSEAGHGDPLCLNFASAKNPGGGFLGGAEAQEENLAKSSGLYPCIVQKTAFYEGNRALRSCLYNDDMIYSPRVPVFRDDRYALIDRPFAASMITAPAVNRGALANNEPERLGEIEDVMHRRVDKLLSVATAHGHTVLVLGAWGCGVFRNRPEDMARWFAAQLLDGGRYSGVFELVSFAVLDRKDDGTFAAFNRVFGAD